MDDPLSHEPDTCTVCQWLAARPAGQGFDCPYLTAAQRLQAPDRPTVVVTVTLPPNKPGGLLRTLPVGRAPLRSLRLLTNELVVVVQCGRRPVVRLAGQAQGQGRC